MFDLVKKDFIIGGIFLAVIAVVIPFLTVMSVVTMIDTFGGLVLGFFIPMIIVICVGSSFIFIGIDAAFNADTIYASLPVKKSTIIYARYFTSFIMILFSFTLIAFTSLVSLHLFHKTDPLLMLFLSIRGIIGTILFLLFILIFYLPFIFKFGPGKGMSVALIAQIGLVLIVPVGKFTLKALQGVLAFDLVFFTGLFDAIRKWVMGLSTNGIYLFIFTLLLVLTLISMGLSTRLYKKKEI